MREHRVNCNDGGSDSSGSGAVASVRSRRVLIYGMNYTPELIGVGRYTGELGAYLSSRGIEVDVVTAVPHYPGWTLRDGGRNGYRSEKLAGARIARCPLLLRAEMRGIWRLLAPLSFAITSAPVVVWRILSTRPDAVLCVEPTLLAAPAALVCAKLVGARTVLHVQDLEVDAAFAVGHLTGDYFRKAATLFERVVLGAFDAVVTISCRMRDRLAAKGVPEARLSVVRNWVDLDKIKPMPGRSTYRDELCLSDDAFVALYAGNIGPKQALHVVLDAAGQLAGESGLIFVIAGDGPEKKSLEARYGHLPNVRFLPVQPEERLCELLNLADVHLLPQDRGAADLVLPSKLGGMLASGRPCIVMADQGTELYDFLNGGAILLRPGDSVALARAISRSFERTEEVSLSGNDARLAALNAGENLAALSTVLFRCESVEMPHDL